MDKEKAELAKAQATLKRDQNQWQSEADQRKRQLQRDNAALEVLTPKVEAKQKELDGLTTPIENAKKELANHKQAIVEIEKQKVPKQAEINDLDKQIHDKKVSIEAELESYRVRRIAEINTDLNETDDSLKKRKKELADTTGTISQKQEELTAIERAVDKANTEATEVNTKNQADAEAIGTKVEAVQALLDEINSELKTAVYERDQALADRDKAKIQYDQFIKYELNARSVLRAKDMSLQEREANIENNRTLLRNARSNLPEM